MISLLLLILLIAFFYQLFKYFLKAAKKTLLKDNIAWSAKELPLRRKDGVSKKSLLSEIQKQSEAFLDKEGFDRN